MYFVNVDVDGFENNFYFDVVCEYVVIEGVEVVVFCNQFEVEFVEFDFEDCFEMFVEMGFEELGFNCVICVGYCLFGLYNYFIVGEKEVCVWIICVGVMVFEVVGVIYFDFECGFIWVEVILYDDFIEFGEKGVKEVGKCCFEGKEYVVQDGEVMNFFFNV